MPIKECDVSGLLCPLSKVTALREITKLAQGESLRIVLGDAESLKGLAQELKARGMQPEFKREGPDRFILTISR